MYSRDPAEVPAWCGAVHSWSHCIYCLWPGEVWPSATLCPPAPSSLLNLIPGLLCTRQQLWWMGMSYGCYVVSAPLVLIPAVALSLNSSGRILENTGG